MHLYFTNAHWYLLIFYLDISAKTRVDLLLPRGFTDLKAISQVGGFPAFMK